MMQCMLDIEAIHASRKDRATPTLWTFSLKNCIGSSGFFHGYNKNDNWN